jgi:hypothetical protein
MAGRRKLSGVREVRPDEYVITSEPRPKGRIVFSMLFLGISVLGAQLKVVADPTEVETVISQLARTLMGVGPYYYVLRGSTFVLLVLAADTGFADFPRLLSLLAQDNVLPEQFAFRGRRLAFSNGIVLAAILAGRCWF